MTPIGGVRFQGKRRALAQAITLPTLPAFGTEGTIEVWAKPQKIADDLTWPHALFDSNPSGVGSVRIYQVYGSALNYDVGGEGATPVTLPVDARDAWHHYAVRWAAGRMAVFFDGAFLADHAMGQTPTRGAFELGRYNTTQGGIEGNLAGFRYYSRALTSDELARRGAGLEVDRTALVVDLPLDEGLGLRALDRSAAPLYDGTFVGGPTWTQPKAERGMRQVNGTNQGVIVSARVLGVAGRSETILCWARLDYNPPNLTNYPTLFGQSAAANTWDFRLDSPVSGNGQIHRAGMAPGAVSFSAAPFPDGRWHHLCLTHDIAGTGQVRLGFDGAPTSLLGTTTGVPAIDADNLVIGNEGTNGGAFRGWPGPIRDFAVFGRVLTDTEVRAVMLGVVKPSDLAGCVLWLPLEGDTLNRAPFGSVAKNRLARVGASTSFEVDAAGWTAYQGTATPVMGAATDGRAALLCVATALADVGVFSTVTQRPPVAPGETVTLGVDVAGPAGDVAVRAQLGFVNAAGTTVGSVDSALTTVGSRAWARLTATGIAPPTAVAASLFVRMPIAAIGDRFLMDAVVLRGGASGAYVPPTEMEQAATVHGKEVNGPRPVLRRARTGLQFRGDALAGATDRVVVADFAPLYGVSAMTFAVLMMTDKPPSSSGEGGIATSNLAGRGAGLNAVSGASRWVTSASSDVALPVGRPTLRVGSVGDGIAKHYADGVLGAVVAATVTPLIAGDDLVIAQYRPDLFGNGWNGTLANVRVWNRVLSDDEVAGLSVGLVPRFGLVGEWLTEGSLAGGIALDTSGLGFHGTITGAVAA